MFKHKLQSQILEKKLLYKKNRWMIIPIVGRKIERKILNKQQKYSQKSIISKIHVNIDSLKSAESDTY